MIGNELLKEKEYSRQICQIGFLSMKGVILNRNLELCSDIFRGIILGLEICFSPSLADIQKIFPIFNSCLLYENLIAAVQLRFSSRFVIIFSLWHVVNGDMAYAQSFDLFCSSIQFILCFQILQWLPVWCVQIGASSCQFLLTYSTLLQSLY